MESEEAFKRVIETLNNNKVMVKKGKDGIYVRFADGDEKKGAFSLEWGKIFSYDDEKRKEHKKVKNISEPGCIYVPYVSVSVTESSDEYNKFMEEYRKLHALCPVCGSKNHSTTLVGYVLNMDKKDEYKDKNRCTCSDCKDVHIAHDRVVDVNFKPSPPLTKEFSLKNSRYSLKKINSKHYTKIKFK